MAGPVGSDGVRPRRRWVVIGPGIVLAALLATQIALNQHRGASSRPIIEHQVVGADAAPSTDPALEIQFILDRAETFALSNGQIESLTDLEAESKMKSAPIESDLDRAAKAFERFMSQRRGKLPVAEIQKRGATVSELSRQMAVLRRVYWEKALQALDPQQRKAVEQAAQADRDGSRPDKGGRETDEEES